MDSLPNKEIKERFDILPEKIKFLLTKEPWLKRIDTIAEKYGFTEDQREVLREETFFVLLGIKPFSTYRSNLVLEGDLTYDQGLKIAYDTNSQIFAPVTEILKEMEKEIKRDESESDSDVSGDVEDSRAETTQTPRPAPLSERIPLGNQPNRLLMDHEETERVDGVHLHSQNVMPSGKSAGSIVDQKLGGIVHSVNRAPQTAPTNPYKGSDPYREPLK